MRFKLFLEQATYKPRKVEFAKCFSDNLERYYEILNKNIPEGYKKEILGNLPSKDKIMLLTPVKPKKHLANILVLAGIHGEEKAGPWGLLYFLRFLF